mmetsp:Transcript_42666/g.69168  ORF Transcript_42666/g.69168 Transcript_42666/m.69168 type:complete len:100 (-) Transcript_42666:685-984(-)
MTDHLVDIGQKILIPMINLEPQMVIIALDHLIEAMGHPQGIDLFRQYPLNAIGHLASVVLCLRQAIQIWFQEKVAEEKIRITRKVAPSATRMTMTVLSE